MNKLYEKHLKSLEYNLKCYKLDLLNEQKTDGNIVYLDINSTNKTSKESANITRNIAIGFAEFITNKNWKEYIDIDTGDGTKIYWSQYKNLDKYYTTEELFTEYLKTIE